MPKLMRREWLTNAGAFLGTIVLIVPRITLNVAGSIRTAIKRRHKHWLVQRKINRLWRERRAEVEPAQQEMLAWRANRAQDLLNQGRIESADHTATWRGCC